MLRQLVGISIFTVLFSLQSFAQENILAGSVLVESETDMSQSYKQRRGHHGFTFGFQTESFDPINYSSQFNAVNGTNYILGDVIGDSPINFMGVEFGYKYNVEIASIGAVYGYATAAASGVSSTTGVQFTKQSLDLNLALDGILEEPWVVPYVQVGIAHMSVSEDGFNGTDPDSATAVMTGLHYKYGLLFQLDWFENIIDKDAKSERLYSSGLQNTFVDVYFSEYPNSSDSNDPDTADLSSSGQMGFGLKLEF